MDRNEEFRKRLDKRLNPDAYKGRSVSKGGFDPTPYVDILMEKIDYEGYEDYEDVENLQEFMDEVLQDPRFDFIFGSTSLLSLEQKTKTSMMLLKRIRAFHDFDPKPHVNSLFDTYGTPAFDKYLDTDEEDDEEYYDFEPYFVEHGFTKEQKDLVEDGFYSRLSDNTMNYTGDKARDAKMLTPQYAFMTLVSAIIFVIIPSFFIPNLLQNYGWLPSDAGWFLKIGVGVISLVVLFFIFKKIMGIVLYRMLKNGLGNINDN